MAYSDKVLDHYENPRNVGKLDDKARNVGTGMVGAPACGDVMRLQIQINDDGIIEYARFKTYGCGSAWRTLPKSRIPRSLRSWLCRRSRYTVQCWLKTPFRRRLKISAGSVVRTSTASRASRASIVGRTRLTLYRSITWLFR